jgi:predicted DNA-binding mobile mystery protein A
MTPRQRKLRRLQIDSQLSSQSISSGPARPIGGWVHSIREALGMTLDVFGARLGMSRQSAHQLEQSEKLESISIRRLRAAAEALECELVVYLKPKLELEALVEARAKAAARAMIAGTQHTMTLENQTISDEHMRRLIDETAEELVRRNDQRVWK